MTYHPRLQRHLDRLGAGAGPPSAAIWDDLLARVSADYASAEPAAGHREAAAEHGKLGAVIGSLGEGLLVLDADLRVESLNRQGEAILGRSARGMVGRPIDELAAGWSLRDRGPYAVSKMRHHLLRGLPYRNDDAFVVADDGSIVHVSLVMTPIEQDGRRSGAVICFRDVTSLKTSESRLRQSEERFRRIFRQAPTGMVRIDADGTIAESNQAFQHMLGYADSVALGTDLGRLWHPQDAQQHAAVLADLLGGARSAWQGECRFIHADGSTVETNTSLALASTGGDDEAFAIGVVEDETERKRLEVELRHAQKLESVGRLAAGIAHEINTPIQFIGDNVRFIGEAFQTLRGVAQAGSAVSEAGQDDLQFLTEEVPLAVEQTLDGVERVAGIVRAMKTFGHPETGVRTAADINEAVQTTLVVARSEMKYVADVRTELAELPAVPCFLGDLNQVLLNLFVNAAHAVEESVGDSGAKGTITVATRVQGAGVEVAVTDTGSGIPEAIRHRLFDPFFTTKAVGKGTGQGLALAHAVVVERHGGELGFDTEIGRGTTFRLWLPLAPAPSGSLTQSSVHYAEW